MSYDSKCQAALSLCREYNSHVPSSIQINADEFLLNVIKLGGINESSLKRFSYEELMQCIPFPNSIVGQNLFKKPTILMKEIAAIFRGELDVETDHAIGMKKVAKMSQKELIKSYDPNEWDNEVGKKLTELSKGEKFLVYVDDVLDCEVSYILLQEIRKGFKGRDLYRISNEAYRVYAVGPKEQIFDENPIYVDRPLRPDGTCDQLNRSWAGIDKECRQFVRIAICDEKGIYDSTLNKVTISNAHYLLDIALQGIQELRYRMPEVAIRFDHLRKIGKLPPLIMTTQFSTKQKLRIQ